MSFRHIDRFAHVPSPVTRVPPAGRIVGTVALALATATLPPGAWVPLGLLALVSLFLLGAARVPFSVAVARLAWPLAFVLVASAALLVMVPGEPVVRIGPVAVTTNGADRFATVMARAMVALVPAVLLARGALMRRTATIVWRMLSTGEAWRPGKAAAETPSAARDAEPVRPRRGRRAVLSALVAKETEAGGRSTGSSSLSQGEEVTPCQA